MTTELMEIKENYAIESAQHMSLKQTHAATKEENIKMRRLLQSSSVKMKG